MHGELVAAIARIHRAALGSGKRTGIYCTFGEQAREYAEKGGVSYDFGRGGYDRHTGVLCVDASDCEGELQWQRQRWWMWRRDQDVV